MQPSPRAETSKLLLPSLRFCIVPPAGSAPHVSAAGEAENFRLASTMRKCSLPTLSAFAYSLKFLPDPPKLQNCDSARSPSASDGFRGMNSVQIVGNGWGSMSPTIAAHPRAGCALERFLKDRSRGREAT